MRWPIIALALALIPAACFAGDPRLLFMAAAQKGITVTANAINGVSSISSGGTTDTGTGNGFGTGTISVYAECDATGGDGADIYLYVNGAEADVLSCTSGSDASGTLTASVSGAYTVRVFGVMTSGWSFNADTFSLPVQ